MFSGTITEKLKSIKTRKSCSETSTKAALRYRQSAILNWYRSANFLKVYFILPLQLLCKISEIMRIKIDRQLAILDFISAKFVMGYTCVVLTFCSICLVQLFCFVFELRKHHKITQIQNCH